MELRMEMDGEDLGWREDSSRGVGGALGLG